MTMHTPRRLAAALLALVTVAHPASAQSFFSMFHSKSTGKEVDSAMVQKAGQEFAASHEDWLRPYFEALYLDGEWGAVLHFQRLGLAAMEKKRYGLARKAFDEAIVRVEAIYADEPNAAKARSVFNAEAVKDFKGEPYERSMLYFYRGLLYLQEGDYQNARAAFLAADRHNTLSSAEATAFKGDFGLMKYMAGWASYCDGDAVRGEQLVQEARAADSKMDTLPEKPANSMVLVDTGPAPVKWGDGEYKHILKFKAGEGADDSPQLRTSTGNTITSLLVAGDLAYQATTRGGREVDGIMAGKAQFKESAGTVGNVATTFGMQAVAMGAMSGNRDMTNAGFAGMFIGLIAKGVEASANPAADLRAWDTLPARILVHVEQDVASPRLELLQGGQPAAMPLMASHGRCSLAWGRYQTLTAPPTADSRSRNVEENRGDRNRALREALARDFAASGLN